VNKVNLLLPVTKKPETKPVPLVPEFKPITPPSVTKAQVYKRQDPASQFKRLSFF